MKILWLSWKDSRHPLAGGAEVVLSELSKQLVAEGHQVTILTAAYAGAPAHETANGITYIRLGANRYTHSFRAALYYLRHLRNKFDVVIEVVNTAPYFSVLFGGRARRLLLYHQLAREIWFHETGPGLQQLGYYALEPAATRLLAMSRVPTIAMSPSTKNDLQRFGFSDELMHIISEGHRLPPLKDLRSVKKYERPTLLSFGAMRSMKRTLDQIKAFEIAKRSSPDLQLKIGGSNKGLYGQKCMAYIQNSSYKKDIEYLGFISDEQKRVLMQKAHLFLATSVKEGWCIVVTEAASQGTPAVVYNVDGLRDSVRHNQTGIVTEPNPEALAKGIVGALQDETTYNRLREQAWRWSHDITFEQSYADFKRVLEVI